MKGRQSQTRGSNSSLPDKPGGGREEGERKEGVGAGGGRLGSFGGTGEGRTLLCPRLNIRKQHIASVMTRRMRGYCSGTRHGDKRLFVYWPRFVDSHSRREN